MLSQHENKTYTQWPHPQHQDTTASPTHSGGETRTLLSLTVHGCVGHPILCFPFHSGLVAYWNLILKWFLWAGNAHVLLHALETKKMTIFEVGYRGNDCGLTWFFQFAIFFHIMGWSRALCGKAVEPLGGGACLEGLLVPLLPACGCNVSTAMCLTTDTCIPS